MELLTGKQIKGIRVALGHTQEEFAPLIGKGLTVVKSLEKDRSPLDVETMIILLKLFRKAFKGLPLYINEEDLLERAVDKAKAALKPQIDQLQDSQGEIEKWMRTEISKKKPIEKRKQA